MPNRLYLIWNDEILNGSPRKTPIANILKGVGQRNGRDVFQVSSPHIIKGRNNG